MNTTAIALVIVVLLTVGLYIGISSLTQQYAVEPSGSNAGQNICAPDSAIIGISQPITFRASLPEGTTYYWGAPDGTGSFVTSGPLTVSYARTGTKTVSLFYLSGTTWRRTICTVQVH